MAKAKITSKDKLDAWIDDNWNIITFLADLEEKGIDFVEFIDIASLMRKSNKAGVKLSTLTTFIIQHESAESADNGRFHVAGQ
jgi:hypothetical protein